MRTILTTNPVDAANVIKNGGICAFPTETVYGLGANVFDESAVAKIFEAKRRPADNPLIAHVSQIRQIEEVASAIPETAQKFIDSFFPGPLTVVLPKSEHVPLIATAGLDTIGVRMPRFEMAHEFLQACGVPVVAPSANLSGRPSSTTWEAVFEDLNGRVDCILQGAITEIGLESTVVDCTSQVPLILRFGAVSLEELRRVVPETEIYQAVNTETPRSPGQKHKHYSPTARIVLVENSSQIPNGHEAAFIGLEKPKNGIAFVKLCDSPDDYAHSLFAFFRECDDMKIVTIYCQTVKETGIGAALMDRLRRAAE